MIVFFTIPKDFFLCTMEKGWLSLAWGAPAVLLLRAACLPGFA